MSGYSSGCVAGPCVLISARLLLTLVRPQSDWWPWSRAITAINTGDGGARLVQWPGPVLVCQLEHTPQPGLQISTFLCLLTHIHSSNLEPKSLMQHALAGIQSLILYFLVFLDFSTDFFLQILSEKYKDYLEMT